MTADQETVSGKMADETINEVQGALCGTCGGNGRGPFKDFMLGSPRFLPCPDCNGTGRMEARDIATLDAEWWEAHDHLYRERRIHPIDARHDRATMTRTRLAMNALIRAAARAEVMREVDELFVRTGNDDEFRARLRALSQGGEESTNA